MAHVPQALTVRSLDKHQAARAFEPIVHLDPERKTTAAGAAMAGHCFAVAGPGGVVAVSVDFGGGVAWVVAAAGGGGGMASDTLGALEHLARRAGFHTVGFQTLRRGLVRVAQRRGYINTGTIGAGIRMEKKL